MTAAKYTILRKIADGGMAEIFLGQLEGVKGFQKLVVIKRIRSDFFPDSQSRDMLVDEAHVAMSLNHSNIVHVLDLGEMKGKPFLALELVEGWSLAQLVRRAHEAKMELSPELSLYLVAQVCRGLEYAHTIKQNGEMVGLVHRDVSPQNILVSEHGDVKLTDFGIAKVRNRTEKTAAGVVKGKIAFMSPEQAQGAPLDARSDLFSLGTVLYALVTDKLPFAAATDLESMVRIQAAEFPPPTKHKPKLKGDLNKLILKAMKLRPSDRFQSAGQMLVEVEKVMRTAYRPVGQTELKQFLDELYAKDQVPPVHRDPTLEKTELEPESGWAEVNESAIVPPTIPPKKGSGPKLQQPIVFQTAVMPGDDNAAIRIPTPKQKKRRRWPAAVAFVAVVLIAWVALSRRKTSVEVISSASTPQREEAPAQIVTTPRPTEIALVESTVGILADAGTEVAEILDAGDEGPTGEVVDEEQEQQLLSTALQDPTSEVVGEVDAGMAPPRISEKPKADPPRQAQERPSITSDDAAKSGTVFVLVQSVPTGAVVRVGDRVFGKTPLSLRFKTGTLFELIFAKSGHQTTKKLYMVSTKQGQRITAVLPKASTKRATRGKR